MLSFDVIQFGMNLVQDPQNIFHRFLNRIGHCARRIDSVTSTIAYHGDNVEGKGLVQHFHRKMSSCKFQIAVWDVIASQFQESVTAFDNDLFGSTKGNQCEIEFPLYLRSSRRAERGCTQFNGKKIGKWFNACVSKFSKSFYNQQDSALITVCQSSDV